MGNYLRKKTVGFYITVAATILAIVALVMYAGVTPNTLQVTLLVAAAIAVEVVMIVLTFVLGNKPILELGTSISAVLMAYAIVQSFMPELDSLGMVVSGLYTFQQIFSFVLFAAFGIASMVLYLVASFMSLGKAGK